MLFRSDHATTGTIVTHFGFAKPTCAGAVLREQHRHLARPKSGGHRAQRVHLQIASHSLGQINFDEIAPKRVSKTFHRGATGEVKLSSVVFCQPRTCHAAMHACFLARLFLRRSRHACQTIYKPMAAIPARAICASSFDLTPLTPTAPRH